MGLFTSESTSDQDLTVKGIRSPFGNVTPFGDEGFSLGFGSDLQGQNFNLFNQATQGQLQNFLDFDQQGFTQGALDNLRQQAQGGEQLGAQQLVGSLFNRGILGRNVGINGASGQGFIQPEIFQLQEALAQQDLQRQLAAIGLGQTQASEFMRLAQGGVQGANALASVPLGLGQLATQGGNQAGTQTSTPSAGSTIAGLGAGFATGGAGLFAGGALSALGGAGGFGALSSGSALLGGLGTTPFSQQSQMLAGQQF
jgi:hypothetical protein